MSRYHSYINSSLRILQSYDGGIPFSIFIKQFFSKEKKYGSKDRKQISSLCYSWFRLGTAFNKELTEDNLLKALFLLSGETSPLLEHLTPEWNRAAVATFEEKLSILDFPFTTANIFPFTNELNAETGTELFYKSLLQQPDLFIRLRPHHKKVVIEKISNAGIGFGLLNHNNTVCLSPGIHIENIVEVDKEVVIQDYNSQQVLDYLRQERFFLSAKEIHAWDCCAASGGKSILLYDILNGKVTLTVSDIRPTIIANLQQRFKKAGIKNYRHFVADTSIAKEKLPTTLYDIIICDAPCTGSGTWARTPEQLYYFDVASINEFAEKQKNIATNALSYLKENGLFFYITCSVFTKENEAIAGHISSQSGIELVEMKNLHGFTMKADSMFVAVFKKQSAKNTKSS